MKKLVIMFLAIIITVGLVGCAGKKEATNANSDGNNYKKVRLGYPTAGSDYIGGLPGVAQDKGYFEEELNKVGYTLDYSPFAGAGPAVNDAVVSGNIDVVIYADFPGIVLKSKGVKVDLLGVISDKGNAQIIVKGDSKIKSLADLKGKKIGFPKGTYVQKYLIEALASVGLTEKDVQLINMASDAQSALLTGNVDALAHVDSLTEKLISTEKNIRAISSTGDNKEWGGTSIFLGRNEYLKENPDVATAMFKALFRAKEEVKKSPEDYYETSSKRGQMPLDAAKAINNLDGGKFDYLTLEITDGSLKKIKTAKEFLLKIKLISDDFDVNSWIDSSYYKKALSEYKK